MEVRYIRFDQEKVLEARRQLLSAELDTLQTAKRIRNYKILRKKELVIKTNLKTALRKLRTEINSLQSTFPEQEMPEMPKRRIKRKKEREKQNIQEQLQEIQEKLARLQ